MDPVDAWRRVLAADVARLATASAQAVPHLVPVTFAAHNGRLHIAVDHKPKSTTRLQRLRDVEANPAVSLLVDHYDPDWTRLWWARVDGPARVLEPAEVPAGVLAALRAKYPQYRDAPLDGPMLAIDPARTSGWSYS